MYVQFKYSATHFNHIDNINIINVIILLGLSYSINTG